MNFVYCAAKYTADTRAGILANITHALAHAALVAEVAHPVVPHTAFPQATDWDDAMRRCKGLLLNCNAVYMVPGWEDSRGAVQEREWAMSVGLPVFYDVQAIRAWVEAA